MQFRRRLGWLIAALLALPLLAVVLALGAAGLALETAPRLAGREAVTAEALDRARQLLRSHHPRRQRPGVMRVMVAEERDLQLLLSHGAARFPDAATALALRTGQAELSLSLPLASPWVPPAVVRLLGPRRWINLEVALRQGQGLPEVERWRIGRLPMPAWALPLVARQVLSRAGISVEEAWTADLVRQVDFRDRRLARHRRPGAAIADAAGTPGPTAGLPGAAGLAAAPLDRWPGRIDAHPARAAVRTGPAAVGR
ncbi:MAG: hypothetical protein ACOVQT_12630 [Rubrivivax sp.]